MDNDDVDKVNELARSLYEKHLAVSMEEAVEKAKQIILHTDMPPVGVSIEYADETMENLDKIEVELHKEEHDPLPEPDMEELDDFERRLKRLKSGDKP